MTRIPTFGFSAFLGMLFLTERSQRTKIKKRLTPAKKGGIDYHLPFRQAARQLISDGRPLEEVITLLQRIKQDARRISAVNGIKQLAEWDLLQGSKPLKFDHALYKSPNGVFQVKFEPDMGLDIGGRYTAIHIWNNKAAINPTMTLSALTLLRSNYASMKGGPDNWAVLSTKDLTLYPYSATKELHVELAAVIVDKVEKMFLNIRSEISAPITRSVDEGEEFPDNPA